MVKRVIVPFDFHSMSKHILHILSFLIILSITPSSCYLNPQRESDTSEAGLKGKVKYVKLNESYTEEYNKDGYLIKSIYPCNDYDEYKYDWHGYLKEMTSAHLLDYKITCASPLVSVRNSFLKPKSPRAGMINSMRILLMR